MCADIVVVTLEQTSYEVSEGESVMVCASIISGQRPITIQFTTMDGTAGEI